MNNSIKLLEVGQVNGNRRFQSQLYVGRDTVDFIMEDGIMRCWMQGKGGFDFHPYLGKYEIVSDKKQMNFQTL